MTTTPPATPALPLEPTLDVPSELGIMQGFPPPPEKRIGPANQLEPIFMRWSMMNPLSMTCVAPISRGQAGPSALGQGPQLDLDTVRVDDGQGTTLQGRALYERFGLNAMVVLHKGRLACELYLGDMRPDTRHMVFSCTKSFVGTLAAMYVRSGALAMDKPAQHYIPELAGCALGSATVEQLQDMRANFRFGDKLHAGGTLQLNYLRAAGILPRPADSTDPAHVYALLQSSQAEGTHGVGPFRYDNGCTETLTWLLQRVTGQRLSTLIAQHFWTPLGMEQDAFMVVDSIKAEAGAVGLSACVRDLARFGDMLRCDGTGGGRQLVAPAVIADIVRGGDRAAFAASTSAARRVGGSYRYQWWVNHDQHDSYEAKGQFGQRIWIAPGAQTVIAVVSTDPDFTNRRDPLRLAFFHAIVQALT